MNKKINSAAVRPRNAAESRAILGFSNAVVNAPESSQQPILTNSQNRNDLPIGKIKFHHANPNGKFLFTAYSTTTYHSTVIHKNVKPNTKSASNTAAALTLAAAFSCNHVL